ncbi:MAG TPA: PEP-CTERM sorting domain-containing protein [Phycisphaerales bacterium]
MKKFVCVGAAALLASGASGAIVYQTSFEAPEFAIGNINGQSSWSADAGTIANTAGGARTGSQYARMLGSNFTATNTARWAWDTSSSLTPATLASAPIVRASVWTQMSGNAGTRSFTAGLDCYDSNIARIGLIFIGNDGSVNIIDGTGVTTSSAAGLINPGNYHKLTIEMNFATQTSKFFVDNIDTGVIGTFGSTDFADADVRGTRSTGTGGANFEMRFDDYVVENEAIPAPGAFALLGLGGLVASRRRRGN